jgi:DNA-binding MarR family transcriptional regulator
MPVQALWRYDRTIHTGSSDIPFRQGRQLKARQMTVLLNEEQLDINPTHAQQQSSDGALHVVRRLRRAFLSICRCGDAMFSPYRLTTEQYALMRAVQRSPGIGQSEITDQIFAEPNTVTAMVTLLEKRGILRRKPSPTDGRVRQLFLTVHGQTVLQRLSADWTPARELLRKSFSGEAGQRALEILDQVFTEMQRERENLLQKANSNHLVESEFDEVAPKSSRPTQPRRLAKNGRETKP